MIFPSLYPILDSSFLPPSGEQRRLALRALLRDLVDAGVQILDRKSVV